MLRGKHCVPPKVGMIPMLISALLKASFIPSSPIPGALQSRAPPKPRLCIGKNVRLKKTKANTNLPYQRTVNHC